MNVETQIKIYEINNEEVKDIDGPKLSVQSHWNRNEFVVIKVGSELVTVRANQLQAAIDNATNWKR